MVSLTKIDRSDVAQIDYDRRMIWSGRIALTIESELMQWCHFVVLGLPKVNRVDVVVRQQQLWMISRDMLQSVFESTMPME